MLYGLHREIPALSIFSFTRDSRRHPLRPAHFDGFHLHASRTRWERSTSLEAAFDLIFKSTHPIFCAAANSRVSTGLPVRQHQKILRSLNGKIWQ